MLDLGCGTGPLTLTLADRVRAVIGMDPGRDMLERARQVARDGRTANATWILGADSGTPDDRAAFAEQVRAVLPSTGTFTEPVRVAMLIGTRK